MPTEGQIWPRESGGGEGGTRGWPGELFATFDPDITATPVDIISANRLYVMLATVPKTGRLHDLAILPSTAVGTVSVAIYDDDGNRLWTSGSVATPTGGQWGIVGDPDWPVTEGEDLWIGFSCSSATPTFADDQNPAAALSDLPDSFPLGTKRLSQFLATSHPAPATIDFAAMTVARETYLVLGQID